MASKKENQIKAHCPLCGPMINANVMAQYKTEWENESGGAWGHHIYMVLECAGCEEVFFCEEYWHSEVCDERGDDRYTFFPRPRKIVTPDWVWELTRINENLRLLVENVYDAFNNDLNIPAAIACRTAFDKASEILGVDVNLSFEGKLRKLHELSLLGLVEKAHLDVLTDAGSAAAHRGWMPADEQLKILIHTLEAFIYRCFIANAKVAELEKAIPPRKKKKP